MLHQIIFNLTLKPGNRLRRSPQEGDKYTGISEFGIRFPKLQSHLVQNWSLRQNCVEYCQAFTTSAVDVQI